MSFRIISSASTRYGIPLGEPMELVTPRFLIHECGFQTRIEYWTIDTVVCPFWCLWHVMEKENWVESEGTCWELGPECILLKPAHVSHSTRSCRPAAQVWLHFSLIPEYAFETAKPFAIPLNSLLREQLSAVIDACGAGREGDTRALYHQSKALLNVCFATYPVPMRVLPDTLRAILQLIDGEPVSDLSNAHLARLAGMSTSSFILWFESHMHQPPATYVRDVRYQKASRMLVFSEASIEQIAAELGYPNRHYFSRIFAARAGCGPATFRKNRQWQVKT
jgi:AraC-like DNA-binding protein